MIFEITGVIHEIGALQTFQAKDGTQFVKQQVILNKTRTDENTQRVYENYPSFEFVQDKCQQLGGFTKGDFVKLRFDINGRKYNDRATGQERYFTTLKGVSMEPYDPDMRQAAAQDNRTGQPAPTFAPQQTEDIDNEDLPF